MRGFKYNTEILMYDGTVKNANQIIIGDIIMGDDSTERHVRNVIHSRELLVKIMPTDSTEPYFVSNNSILCFKYNSAPSLSHEITNKRYRIAYLESFIETYPNYSLTKVKVKSSNYGYKDYDKDDKYNVAKDDCNWLCDLYYTGFPLHELEIFNYFKQNKSFYQQMVCYRTGVDFNNPSKQELNPYLLGAWLGDGSSKGPCITNIDKELLDFLKAQADIMGVLLVQGNKTKYGNGEITYSFRPKVKKVGTNFFTNFLKMYNLWGNKHIPYHYKINTRENRLLLLAGLIDTDGYYGETSYYEITQKNEILSNDIVFLARSLGYWCHIRPCVKGCMYKGEMRNGNYFRITFGGDNLNEIPVLLPRKKAKIQTKRRQKNAMHYKVNITQDIEDDCCAFELSGNHRFVLSDFTVTHD